MNIVEELSFEDMTDDERLEYVQLKRHDVINGLTTSEDGSKVLCVDKDQAQILRGMLKDMDSSIYTKRRLTVDEVGAENDKRMAELADMFMSKVKFIGRDKTGLEQVSAGPVIDESKLPKYDHTKGEIEPVGNQVDLDEIAREGRRIFKGIDDENSDS